MRRLFTALLAAGAIVGVIAPSASAHDLLCSKAQILAGHPNANCRKVSPNHAYLSLPWRTCEEHVWHWHPFAPSDWFTHYWDVTHCSSWSHPT